MTDLKSIYQALRAKGIIKSNTHPEYEPEVIRPISPKRENAPEPENPAQSDEVKDKNRQEFLSWRESLPDRDKADFVAIFGE